MVSVLFFLQYTLQIHQQMYHKHLESQIKLSSIKLATMGTMKTTPRWKNNRTAE
jgi:hypothetical protein